MLPAGDPSSQSKFPEPRQGAAVLSASTTLVGDTSMAASDTIVFGGRDVNGTYLSDVWILRAYNATLTKTNATWSGFQGSLQSGINANGQGVTVQYLSQCATSLGGTSTSGSPTSGSNPPSGSGGSGSGSGSGSGMGNGSPSNPFAYNTSMVHKVLGALSVGLFLPAVTLYRISQPGVSITHLAGRNLASMYLGILIGVAAYALGIVGLAISFTSITTISPIAKRSATSIHLQTAHAKAGLVLFAGLYVLVPALQFLALAVRQCCVSREREPADIRTRADSTVEKLSMNDRAASPSTRSEPLSQPEGSKEERRIRSWAGIGTWAGISSRRSNETTIPDDQQTHTPSQRSFEVINRPIRQRRASGNSLAAFSDPRPSHRPRNLSDLSWLDPRRSISRMVCVSWSSLCA